MKQLQAYSEDEDRVFSMSEPMQDEEGSMANLVPGGRASERSRKGGARRAELEREKSKPLKIQIDLELVRKRLPCHVSLVLEGRRSSVGLQKLCCSDASIRCCPSKTAEQMIS